MQTEHIAQLLDFLKQDQTSRYPKYPVQAMYALKDERVANTIAERLQKNGTLTNITALSYSFSTGLIPICFEFTRPGIAGLGPTALLVLLDHRCNVVGIIDPFDPAQPNPTLPPLPKTGEQPFVLSRPSAAGIVSGELLYSREARTREFFRELRMPKGVRPRDIKLPSDDGGDDDGDGGGDGGGVGGGGGGSTTYCPTNTVTCKPTGVWKCQAYYVKPDGTMECTSYGEDQVCDDVQLVPCDGPGYGLG